MSQPSLSAPQLAQALMAFALQTSEAAQELLNTPPGEPLTAQASHIIAIWRNIQPVPRVYLHPSAEAIAVDTSTETFAIIVATRAIKDAIEESALSPAAKVYAAIELALSLAAGDDSYVDDVLFEVRSRQATPIPIELVRETMSKALIMAASFGKDKKPLPVEMVDFVEHALWMASSARFQFPDARGPGAA